MKHKCASCKHHSCYTVGKNCTGRSTEEIVAMYGDKERKMMEAAAWVEATFYNNLTRLQETAQWARAMGYKKLGMAFCIGLSDEAHYIERFFENEGFEFYSACCKCGSVNKKELGLKQVRPELEHEAMCNPKLQAYFLNEKECDLYLVCGLCVGHDTIFASSCNGPVSTLVVKDRVLGHNPLAAIYSRYWKRKLKIQDEDEI